MYNSESLTLFHSYPHYCVIARSAAGVIDCYSQHSSYEGARKDAAFWNNLHAVKGQVSIVPFEIEIL